MIHRLIDWFKTRSDGRAGEMEWDAETLPSDTHRHCACVATDKSIAARMEARKMLRDENPSRKGWQTRRAG